jgi:hypothetical protein
MNIAFVHYHVKTGGVTTVLRQQIESIHERCRVLTLTGTQPATPFPEPITCIPGLGYDHPGTNPADPQRVADAVVAAIRAEWPEGCDVLHVHNPIIAKNRHFLKILKALQERGIKLLLQIHDFAEDGRPQVYFQEDYPADCHYGVINSRDYRILRKAGLKPEGLHHIPNTINPLVPRGPKNTRASYALYPIRAIRRKNIGEAILLSFFFKGPETLAITLPPNSPGDKPSYENWRRFVADHRLKVAFEVGRQRDFADLVGATRFFITTSITEGFGFSFLEPWSAQKLLWGRALPDVCRDFTAHGIDLDHLYTRLAIPLDWIDKHLFYDQWRTTVADACSRFRYPLAAEVIEKGFQRMTAGRTIDFGMLHEGFQTQIAARILSQKSRAGQLTELNPFLKDPGNVADGNDVIARNRAAVLAHYTGTRHGEHLLNTYRQVAGTAVRHAIDKNHLIAQFLNVDAFSLLKWKPYVQ